MLANFIDLPARVQNYMQLYMAAHSISNPTSDMIYCDEVGDDSAAIATAASQGKVVITATQLTCSFII